MTTSTSKQNGAWAVAKFDYLSRALVILAGVIMGLGTYQFQALVTRVNSVEEVAHSSDRRLVRIEETYMPATQLLPLFQDGAIDRTKLAENQKQLLQTQKLMLQEFTTLRTSITDVQNTIRKLP